MASTPLKLHGTVGGVDKNGCINIQVKYWVATLPECYRYTPTDLGISLPLVSRTFTQCDGEAESSGESGYEVTLHFEGAEADFKYSDTQITFEFDASMAEEPIQSHPSFDKLKKKYGWSTADKAFPETMPTNSTASNALSADATKTGKSPLYGCDSYLAVGAVFRKTYISTTVPSHILKGIGTIVSKPPGIGQFYIPPTGSKRNWLKTAPKVRRRGSAVEVTEEWMLSGPAGWNKDVYGGDQLNDTGDGSAGSDSGGSSSGGDAGGSNDSNSPT